MYYHHVFLIRKMAVRMSIKFEIIFLIVSMHSANPVDSLDNCLIEVMCFVQKV